MNGKDKLQSKVPTGTTLQRRQNPPPRILVVDDEPDIRNLNTELLLDSGYCVDAAEDGAVAWNILQTKNYNLLITDNEMPKVSGVELIKKIHDAKMTLPVIMVTATWPEDEFNQNPKLRPKAKLLKPYSIVDLLVAVEKILLPADHVRESA